LVGVIGIDRSQPDCPNGHGRASARGRGLYELVNDPIQDRHFEDWPRGFAEPVRSELQRISQASSKPSRHGHSCRDASSLKAVADE
jgi:hypothetical protein